MELVSGTPDEEFGADVVEEGDFCPSPRRRLSGESEFTPAEELTSSVSEEDFGESTKNSTLGLGVHPDRGGISHRTRKSTDRFRVWNDSPSSIATTVISSPQARPGFARRSSGTPTSHRLGLGRRGGLDSCSKCLELESTITFLKEGELGLQKHLETCKHNLQLRDTELEKQEKLIAQLQTKLKEFEDQLKDKEATITQLRKSLRAEKEKAIYGKPVHMRHVPICSLPQTQTQTRSSKVEIEPEKSEME